MGLTADALSRILWLEAALAVPAVVFGLVPWLVFTSTELRAPRGYQTIWLLAALLLVLLWVVLLAHLATDCWRLLRDGAAHLTEWGGVHVGFRTVESLGVVAPPVVLQVIASRVTDGPDAHGLAAIGGLFIVMGVLAANAVVVVLHAGWLLGIGEANQTASTSTP